MLPQKTALKLFGSIDIIGETVNARILSSEIDFQVTGVIENIPSNSHLQFDYLGSLNTMQSWSQLTDTQVASANFLTYLLLNSPGSISSVTQTGNQFVADNMPDRLDGLEFFPYLICI